MEETTMKTGPKVGRKSRAEIQAEMTSSPEFKLAVADAVKSALAAIIPTMEAARTQAVSGNDMGSLFEKMAMSIAELSNQGSGKVKVAPEEMQRREEARKRMKNLIIEARAEGKVPTYQIRNKIFLNERIIEPFWMGSDRKTHPTEIDFWGIPNEVMVPVSEAAKEIFAAFRESIGTVKGVHGVANALPGDDDIAITRGGLVVRNGAINSGMRKATPERPSHERQGPMPAYEEDEHHDYQPLRVNSDQQKNGFKDIAVLGTIHPPARQNV